MSNNFKNININEFVNNKLEETVEIAKTLAITLDEQGDQINNTQNQINLINNDTKSSLKTIKKMNSSFYRWWSWLVDLGTEISTSISNTLPTISNNNVANTSNNNTTNNNTANNNTANNNTANNTATNNISNNNTANNNIYDIDNPAYNNLEILKELSINIGTKLTEQCNNYTEISELVDINRDRIKKCNSIAKKI